MGRRLGMLSPVSGDGLASTHSIEGGTEGVVTAELPCGRAARAVRLQCRCVRGVGRVRRGVQLPPLELPRGHWLRVPALGRDRAREADGDQGHSHAAPRRRSRRPPRDTLRDVPLAALLGGSSTSSEGARGDGAIRLAVSTTSNVPVAHADETGRSARERLGTISSENARVLAHRIAEAGSLTSYPFDSRFTFGSIVALLLIVKLVGSR